MTNQNQNTNNDIVNQVEMQKYKFWLNIFLNALKVWVFLLLILFIYLVYNMYLKDFIVGML